MESADLKSLPLELQLQSAMVAHQAGRLEEAIVQYAAIIQADSKQHQACHLLALILYQRGDRENASALWEQAIAAMPTDPIYRNNLGEMLRQLGKLSQAETQFTVAVALKPGFAEAHNNLGLSLLDRKAYDDARQCFETAISLKSDFCQAWNNLGSTLKYLARGADAFDCFLKATELDPDYAMAWNNLGLSCHELKHYPEAEECLRTALRLAPGLVDAYINLGRLLRQTDRLEEALALTKQGLDQPTNKDQRQKLNRASGEVARELGQFDEAREFFAKILHEEPDSLAALANVDLSFSDRTADGYYGLGERLPVAGQGAIRRVAIFAPGDHYLNMLWGLKRAFEKQGITCIIGWPLLRPDALKIFLDRFSPDLVMEINRTRHQARVLPPHVKHIAWVQDGTLAFDQDLDHFGGSDRTYFMAQPEAVGYDPALLQRDEHYGFLLPAADPEVYRPLPAASYSYDFSFAGFIPQLPARSMGPTYFLRQGAEWVLTWQELEALLREANVFQWSVGDCAYPMIHQRLASHLGLAPDEFAIPDVSYPNVTSMMRLLDRKDLLEQALEISNSLLINGPDNWLRWPQFAPHYKGMLYDARALSDSYRSSRIVLHNGVSALHPRTFECLACGALLAINRCYTDDKPGSIQNYLTPGEHYIEYGFPDVREVLRETLADEARAERIRSAARERVLAHHTWDHRVAQLLREL